MITTKTWLENSNTKFCVTFDCTPKDVVYDGHTHVANGTTKRLGIWEGVWLAKVRYKGEDGVWRETSNKSVTLNATKNGSILEVEAIMQIWTMGFPNRDYPFLYFGNYNSNRNKYMHGYFTDTTPVNPKNYKADYAKVPSDWDEVYKGWNQKGKGLDGHWCYLHGVKAGGETWVNVKAPDGTTKGYEYRNGTNSNGANGWTSEEGRKPQETRRNMFWVFEKKYTAKVTSSGLVFAPNKPTISVEYAKGDKGFVTITHTSSGGAGAYIKLASWNVRTGKVSVIDDFGSWLDNNKSKKYEVDFLKHCGGEDGRGSDIKYYAWSKTAAGYLSDSILDPNQVASRHWVGVHRFNARPTVPTGLKVTGANNVFYTDTTFSWGKSTDADNDTITYEVWIRVTNTKNEKVLDKVIASNISDTFYNFKINSYEENSKIEYWVRAYDGRIYSAWSNVISIQKGQGAKPADKLYPLSNSTVYSKKPRILISTGTDYDLTNQVVKVKWNGTWYDNKTHTQYFSSVGKSTKVCFKPPVNANIGACSYSVIIGNSISNSKETTINFYIANNPYTVNDIDPYDFLKKIYAINLMDCANNVRVAYGFSKIDYNFSSNFVKHTHYSSISNALNSVNDFVNNFDSNNANKVNLGIPSKIIHITDYEWDKAIEALNII